MYKAALVGTGFIATKKHLPAWERLRKDVELVAVCDIDRARAERVKGQFGVTAAYTDIDTMLQEVEPDFVDICTPPTTHADIAVKSLKANANVLIEKPLATTIEDCEKIVNAEHQYPGRVEVAHTDLFHQSIIQATERIESGEIGEFTGMRIFYLTPVTLSTADPNHFANRLPGGAMGETGPHVVYIAQRFIGPIKDIWVRGTKLLTKYPWSPYEDYRLELIGEKLTCSAVLTFTSRHAGYWIELWGTDGVLKIDMQSKILINYRRIKTTHYGIGKSSIREATQIATRTVENSLAVLGGRFRSLHDRTIKNFFDCTVNDLPQTVSAADGLETVRIMKMISETLSTTEHQA